MTAWRTPAASQSNVDNEIWAWLDLCHLYHRPEAWWIHIFQVAKSTAWRKWKKFPITKSCWNSSTFRTKLQSDWLIQVRSSMHHLWGNLLSLGESHHSLRQKMTNLVVVVPLSSASLNNTHSMWVQSSRWCPMKLNSQPWIKTICVWIVLVMITSWNNANLHIVAKSVKECTLLCCTLTWKAMVTHPHPSRYTLVQFPQLKLFPMQLWSHGPVHSSWVVILSLPFMVHLLKQKRWWTMDPLFHLCQSILPRAFDFLVLNAKFAIWHCWVVGQLSSSVDSQLLNFVNQSEWKEDWSTILPTKIRVGNFSPNNF